MKVNCIDILLILLVVLSVACKQKPVEQVSINGDNAVVEEEFDPYIEGNRRILALENEEIDLVVKRHHWNMMETGTGLRYQILEPGNGHLFVEGDSVAFNYTISLLSGKEVYNSETDGVKTFRVEKSEEIPALHELAKLVSPGTKVRAIVPSHLAYGAAGDGNKIVGREPLIYSIEIINH